MTPLTVSAKRRSSRVSLGSCRRRPRTGPSPAPAGPPRPPQVGGPAFAPRGPQRAPLALLTTPSNRRSTLARQARRVAPSACTERVGMNRQHDYAEIAYALNAFIERGSVFEIRLLHARNSKRVDSGYFDSVENAASAVAALEEPYAGIYYTPNPVHADLAARAYNRILPWSSHTTTDGYVLRRRWLLIDIDPDRPSGISASDQERANALKVASTIASMLEIQYGWPAPASVSSGNGAHLLYPIDEPNTDEVRDAIHNFLKTLSGRFSALGCTVDTTAFNASRIFRLPGTWARKGDNAPLRPHRKSVLLTAPQEPRQTVTLGQIKHFNAANEKYLTVSAQAAYKAPGHSEYPDDEKKYRGLNEHAMERIPEWVPHFFPSARPYKQGFRVASADIGLDFEEDLTIHPRPLGIKYFGIADQGDPTEGRRTPVSLLSELVFGKDKALAAQRLADILKAPLTEFEILGPPKNSIDTPATAANLPGAAPPGPQFDFRRIPSMADLQARTFKEPNWIIPNVLPTGTILLAARPKMRKTFLALQLALAVCSGRKFLDWQCNTGEVLFLGLEDNERRLRSRIRLLQTLDLNPPDLSGFRYWTGGVDISPTTGKQFVSNPEEAERAYSAFPRGEQGVDALKRFHDAYPRTKLMIIDTYAHFRGPSNNRDVYQRDVDQMYPITRLASEREVCILVVHHEKKGLASQESGDFMEDASGTSGITGTVDGVMSIKGKRGIQEESEERKLLLSGRDIPFDHQIDIAFNAERGGWLTAAKHDVRASVLKLLAVHPYMTQQEFVSVMPNVSRSRISQVLTTMKFENLIQQGRAGYHLPKTFKGDS